MTPRRSFPGEGWGGGGLWHALGLASSTPSPRGVLCFLFFFPPFAVTEEEQKGKSSPGVIQPSLLLLTCPRMFVSWKLFAVFIRGRAYFTRCCGVARHAAGEGLEAPHPDAMGCGGELAVDAQETGAASGRDAPFTAEGCAGETGGELGRGIIPLPRTLCFSISAFPSCWDAAFCLHPGERRAGGCPVPVQPHISQRHQLGQGCAGEKTAGGGGGTVTDSRAAVCRDWLFFWGGGGWCCRALMGFVSLLPRASVSPLVAEGPGSGLAPSLAAEAEFLLCACCARRKVLWESKYSSPRRLQAGCSLSPAAGKGHRERGCSAAGGRGEVPVHLRCVPPSSPHCPRGLCEATGCWRGAGGCSPLPRRPLGCSASLRLCTSAPGLSRQDKTPEDWGGTPPPPKP